MHPAVPIAVSAGLALAAGLVMAQPRSPDAFATVAGEVGLAHSSCGFAVNVPALQALDRAPVAVASRDAGVERYVETVAGGAMRAAERLQRQGKSAFCAEMLAAYGPAGRLHHGLIKTR